MGWGTIGFAFGMGIACFSAFFGSMFDDPRILDTFVRPLTADKEGRVIGGWGITEPDHGSDTLMVGTKQFHDARISCQVRAVLDGDCYGRAAMRYKQSNTPPALEYSIASKVFSTQTAFRCASEGVQILGGNGRSKEYILEKVFRGIPAQA